MVLGSILVLRGDIGFESPCLSVSEIALNGGSKVRHRSIQEGRSLIRKSRRLEAVNTRFKGAGVDSLLEASMNSSVAETQQQTDPRLKGLLAHSYNNSHLYF